MGMDLLRNWIDSVKSYAREHQRGDLPPAHAVDRCGQQGGDALAANDEVALLHERVVPGGAVYLFYEAARPELVPNIVKKASENLLRGGFRVSVVEQKAPPVIGIIARR